MNDEQKKDLQAHIKNNLGRLSEVIQHEHDEQAAIKKNLAEFHAALTEREKNLDAAQSERHAEDLEKLDAQIARLKNFVAFSGG